MNKIVYNATNLPLIGRKSVELQIRINQKKSKITLTKPLAEKIDKRRVNFIQDRDNTEQWYLEITDDVGGFTISKHACKDHLIYSIYNRSLVMLIATSVGLTKSTAFKVDKTEIDGMYKITRK